MREKLHDVIDKDTGEILLEDAFPATVAIFLRQNSELTFDHVEEDFPHEDFDTDIVWVTTMFSWK